MHMLDADRFLYDKYLYAWHDAIDDADLLLPIDMISLMLMAIGLQVHT